jgi:hypothetical protein
MKHGLFIGINYTTVSGAKLNGCINDVVNVRRMLEVNYNYLPENMVMMRDDIATTPNATAEDDVLTSAMILPTRANILAQMQKLVDISASCTEVWLHYSGHGGQARATRDKYETDRCDETILPMDFQTAGIITDNEIFAILRNLKCRAILMFDSCHSGSVCDFEWQFEYKGRNVFQRLRVNPQNAIANDKIIMLSGCKDAQTSEDTVDTDTQTFAGAMTDAVLDTLSRNYTVILPVFYKSVCELMAARRFSQRPVLSSTSLSPNYTFTPVASRGVVTLGTDGVINAVPYKATLLAGAKPPPGSAGQILPPPPPQRAPGARIMPPARFAMNFI